MLGKLTVHDLILDPGLDTSVLAGASGLDRPLTWAQTSEIADPWRWLGDGELLMTVGLNLPSDPSEQCEYIRKINQAGIAAIAIGADGIAPPLSQDMLEEADRLGFPVLLTGPDIPFVVIARTVAAATANQSRSILALSRLYQVAAEQEPPLRKSGAWVFDLFGFRITVADTATGCVVIGQGFVAPTNARVHPLPTIRPTELRIEANTSIDSLALIHLKQILAVDANVILQQALTAIADGETSFLALRSTNDRQQSPTTHASLPEDGPYRVIASDGIHHERIALALALSNVGPLAAIVNERTLAVVGGSHLGLAEEIYDSLDVPAGISAEHLDFRDLTGAASEAANALDQCRHLRIRWAEFEGEQVSLLARSRTEAADIVRSVLGPLTSTEHSPWVLRDSLFRLLDNNMQWQLTATQLGVHRQTLAYRIRRVEQVTGRQLKRVSDLSELWLARQAWDLAREDPL